MNIYYCFTSYKPTCFLCSNDKKSCDLEQAEIIKLIRDRDTHKLKLNTSKYHDIQHHSVALKRFTGNRLIKHREDVTSYIIKIPYIKICYQCLSYHVFYDYVYLKLEN